MSAGGYLSSLLGKHEKLVLFIIIYFIYNINLRTINSGDTWPAAMLPFAILSDGKLYLDMYESYFQSLPFDPHMVVLLEGHYVSFYPIVIPVLLTPFYIIPYLLLNSLNYPLDMLNISFYLIVFILEKLFASLIAAASVVFCFMAWREMMRREIAYICTAIFALATNTWATSSQALWQQGMAELILAMLIYLVVINEKNRSMRKVLYMGLLSGLFIFNRPSDCLLLLPVLVYVVFLGKRHAFYFTALALLSGLPFLMYNVHYFGNVFGGYSSLLSGFVVGPSALVNLSGLLVSPSRGLLIYSPILLLSAFGFRYIKEIESDNLKRFLYAAAIAVLLQIGIYSCFRIWWAGHCYGPRFLVSILPFLVTFIGLYLNATLHFKSIRRKDLLYLSLIALMLIWSIFVQAVGAFYYPNGNWDATPLNVDEHPERLWNWDDSQIGRSFHSGPIFVNPLRILDHVFGESDLQPQEGDANRSSGWSKLDQEGIIGGLKGYQGVNH